LPRILNQVLTKTGHLEAGSPGAGFGIPCWSL
jgi:hypothetical protein